MNSIKYGRMVGVGLGAGLAIAAVYSFTTNTTPDGFQPQPGEFQSLSDWEPDSTRKKSDSRLLEAMTTTRPLPNNSLEMSSTPDAKMTSGDSAIPDFQSEAPEFSQPSTTSSANALASNDESSSTMDLEIELVADGEQLTGDAKMKVSQPKTAASETATAEELDFGAWSEGEQVETLSARAPFHTDQPVDSESTGMFAEAVAAETPIAAADTTEVKSNSWKKNPFLNGSQTPSNVKNVQQIPLVEIPATGQFANSSSVSATASNDNQEIVNRGSDFQVTPTKPNASAMSEFDQLVGSPIQFANASKNTTQRVILPGMDAETTTRTNRPDQSRQDITPLDLTLTESVAQRAAQHIEYGKTLARRGASTSAQQEFYSALRVVAQANDSRAGVNEFSLSLRRGILAMKEAEDFLVTDTETQIGLDVALTAETHRAGVLTAAEAQSLTPLEATQRYFAVAQEQLERAGGHNVVTAEALYCLGKLHSIGSPSDPNAGRLDTAKAIVFHRAALSSDDKNHRSANELGVLLARAGELEEAKSLFKKSLIVNSAPQTWENLAKLHYRLNEPALAQLAQAEYQRATQQMINGSTQWMPPTQFNAEAPVDFHEAIASKPDAAETNIPVNNGAKGEEPNAGAKSLSQRIKDLF